METPFVNQSIIGLLGAILFTTLSFLSLSPNEPKTGRRVLRDMGSFWLALAFFTWAIGAFSLG